VLAGSGRLETADSVVEFGPGDLFLVPEGEAHEIRNPGPDDLRIVAFFAAPEVRHEWAVEAWPPDGRRVTGTP